SKNLRIARAKSGAGASRSSICPPSCCFHYRNRLPSVCESQRTNVHSCGHDGGSSNRLSICLFSRRHSRGTADGSNDGTFEHIHSCPFRLSCRGGANGRSNTTTTEFSFSAIRVLWRVRRRSWSGSILRRLELVACRRARGNCTPTGSCGGSSE